jgi:acetoin utilization deacetylase AcuC-like enzyme
MRVFYSPDHFRHDPPFEFSRDGVYPYSESPRRAFNLLSALKKSGGFSIETPRPCPPETLRAVHDSDYLHFLENIYAAWTAAGKPATGVLPDTFAVGPQNARPSTLLQQTGYYCFDAQTPIVAGTWTAALGSAACAIEGAAALAAGAQIAYALCRPPGHHAATALCGGYSYLNNAALAASHLSANNLAADSLAANSPDSKVAILDIDYHHGNGTQEIFYASDRVLFVSLHADPERTYPYYSGFASERGIDQGEGFTLNLPLASATTLDSYLAALDIALERIAAHAPRYLLLSLGLDIYHLDPLGDFTITLDDFGRIGTHIAALGLPTLVIQEGGYDTLEGGTALTNFLSHIA